jgi:hypothetical protein
LWEICLEAAEYLADERLPFYEHNVLEATRCVESDGRRCPFYFLHHWLKDDELDFLLLPDPCWQQPRWGFGQIHLHCRLTQGDIKWSVDHESNTIATNVRLTLGVWSRARVQRGFPDECEDWGFSVDGGDHIYLYSPKTTTGVREQLSMANVLEVMIQLREALGGFSFGKYLFLESNSR